MKLKEMQVNTGEYLLVCVVAVVGIVKREWPGTSSEERIT